MKLLFENWREYLKEESEAPCDDILWHGSPVRFDGPVQARKAHDVGGNPEQNLKAIYATPDKNLAITLGLTEKGSDIFSDHEKGQLVLVKGEVRYGKQIYLYKLPKDTFRNTGVPSDNPEWVSEVDAQPCDIEEINVDDYLHLVRKATPEDIEFWDKHNIG